MTDENQRLEEESMDVNAPVAVEESIDVHTDVDAPVEESMDVNAALEEMGLTEFSPEDENFKSGFVAVVGAPNAGKSTLVNALMGQKLAIVSPRPQTTRSRQLGILTTEDSQIVFVDTPGLVKKALHKLDEAMIDTVIESIDGADMVLYMVDGTYTPMASDHELTTILSKIADKVPVILAVNKVDLMSVEQVQTNPYLYRNLLPEGIEWIVFSAENGAGLAELHQIILDKLPKGPMYYPADQVTDTYIRTIAGEMVREQILLQMRDEIPHTIAVQVDEYKERDNGLIYIHATIFVERDTHKKIIVGHKGDQIKRIGAAARKQIEPLVGARIYLELRVKTAAKWRSNEILLEKFGYSGDKR